MAAASMKQLQNLLPPFVLGVVLIIIMLISGASSSRILSHDVDGDQQSSMALRHEQWMAYHGRVYADAVEKERRFKIFKENVERIEAFNSAGVDKGYKLGVNQFADLSTQEIRARNGYRRQQPKVGLSESKTSFRYANVTAVPAVMDWRKYGAVTPVKNQGDCGNIYLYIYIYMHPPSIFIYYTSNRLFLIFHDSNFIKKKKI